ncbi:hypothetical protein BDN72DRAFT_857518 [Pluteus cervinus]|uniref:Uncharacterized protein n=1 Tax=Pluteus cervinus TaxID=181527 RepID=A0ACD3AWQ9_9AGAR|nr:hypothetical protein BDN72DRAFT_857518 [Pluteus cervinus]
MTLGIYRHKGPPNVISEISTLFRSTMIDWICAQTCRCDAVDLSDKISSHREVIEKIMTKVPEAQPGPWPIMRWRFTRTPSQGLVANHGVGETGQTAHRTQKDQVMNRQTSPLILLPKSLSRHIGRTNQTLSTAQRDEPEETRNNFLPSNSRLRNTGLSTRLGAPYQQKPGMPANPHISDSILRNVLRRTLTSLVPMLAV